jgi:hypothetical protein
MVTPQSLADGFIGVVLRARLIEVVWKRLER